MVVCGCVVATPLVLVRSSCVAHELRSACPQLSQSSITFIVNIIEKNFILIHELYDPRGSGARHATSSLASAWQLTDWTTPIPRWLPIGSAHFTTAKRENSFCHKMFINFIDFKVPVGSKYNKLYIVDISKSLSIRWYKFHTDKLIFKGVTRVHFWKKRVFAV